MGDFADDALNEAMDAEDERTEFRLGKMSHEEAYEKGIIDELGYDIGPGQPAEECKHEKVFAPYILTSNPPQYPWICRKCGFRGVDRGDGFNDVNEYARLCQEFGAKDGT